MGRAEGNREFNILLTYSSIYWINYIITFGKKLTFTQGFFSVFCRWCQTWRWVWTSKTRQTQWRPLYPWHHRLSSLCTGGRTGESRELWERRARRSTQRPSLVNTRWGRLHLFLWPHKEERKFSSISLTRDSNKLYVVPIQSLRNDWLPRPQRTSASICWATTRLFP